MLRHQPSEQGKTYVTKDRAPISLKTKPFWWEDAPLSSEAEKRVQPQTDIAIVGAGYTGLSAAIVLARAGRSVQVFDKQRPGEGASTRNGGITSGNLRLSHSEMETRFGKARADAIMEEAKVARADLYSFIKEEKIDCDFSLVGRFAGAMSAHDYDKLAKDADYLHRTFGIDAFPVSRLEQKNFLGTDFYYGGNVRMDIGGLHPAKLHAEMLRLAREAGAIVHGETPIRSIVQDGLQHVAETARGVVRARNVIVGTNGYTDGADPWLRRRMVPVRSRIIATEELPQDLMARLMPRLMMCTDTRKLSYYYRPSPDGRRILFGGRDGTIVGEPDWPTEHLRRTLVAIFPELAGVGITHSWFGYVAMHRDMIPRIFSRKGMQYATGYCGSGVVWARWAGKMAAMKLLSEDGAKSAFDFRPPAGIPFFRGKAWFMPGVFAWLSLQDRLSARKSGRH
jgi:glycine/D-amino acid oxidase-like deaminating enzyme